jgi:hypothetical protein
MADSSKRPRTGGSGSESVADSQIGKSWYFSVTKKSYRSLDDLYDAVVHAQRSGKASYWKLVTEQKDVELQTVKLVCLQCDKGMSAKNPADAAKKHFYRKEDGSFICKQAKDMQARIDSALQQASSHQYSGPFISFLCWR